MGFGGLAVNSVIISIQVCIVRPFLLPNSPQDQGEQDICQADCPLDFTKSHVELDQKLGFDSGN
jgi:hypothetical protein